MQYDPKKITFFAETDARGRRQKFGIKADDRTKHVYVIGKTGMGKSTLLENMAVQDIQNGEGLAFIDPHGSTAEKLLEYIPEHRVKDVLYFAPFDMEEPVSFNVMEDVGPDKRHLVVSGLMSTFKKIWVDAWSARMEYILSNTLLALLEYPGSTLLGVNRMLSDKDYRNAVVANIKDPSVRSFWVDEFAKYNERYMQEAGDAIKNKIGQFTANPLIRNIIGQPTSSFDVRKMMDERKILIVNLSKGLIGETNANLLGSMLITKIYLSAMSRADLPAATLKQMPNFYFYVDEFQSFANEAFANILSEARKYKLNLTIAHQYIEQMEESVRNAVFGNVGTIIAFRVGPFDAEVLETIFSPEFTATDIVNLGFAQIYLTLMIDGIGSRPFSATTLGPIPQSKISYKDVVVATSRKQFGKPRFEIEESIHKWHEPIPKEDLPKKPSLRPELSAVLKPHVSGGNNTQQAVRNDRPRERTDAPREPRRDNGHHTAERAEPRRQEQASIAGVRPDSGGRERREGGRQFENRNLPREQRNDRPPRQEKGLDELRSVLKSIATPQEKQHKKPESESTKTPSAQPARPAPPDGKPDLRSALASVLSQVQSTPREPSPEVNREPQQNAGEGHASTSKPEVNLPDTNSVASMHEIASLPQHNVAATQPTPEAPKHVTRDEEREVLMRLEKILKPGQDQKPPLAG